MFAIAIAVLCVCLSIVVYHVVKFVQYTKIQKARKEYALYRYKEIRETTRKVSQTNKKPKTNIFRDMAIKNIASQRLIYDKKSGKYIRRRQIKFD